MTIFLYVEDDEGIRLDSKKFLEIKENTVHPAKDGLEGLEVLKRVDGIEIIFSDGNMPRMGGNTSVRLVKTASPFSISNFKNPEKIATP